MTDLSQSERLRITLRVPRIEGDVEVIASSSPSTDQGDRVSEIVVQQHPVQVLLDLENSGALTPVALKLTDIDMPYERWEDIGRFFGSLDRRSRWYIGDWLLFGEAVYGEQASQGVEATTKERYSEAERVTGLDHGTMMNIRSICSRVQEPQRRSELGFFIHGEVAALDAADQDRWLQKAIDEGWNQRQLRTAIREEKTGKPSTNDADANGVGGASEPGDPLPSRSERIENAARLVFEQASNDSHGDWVVPNGAMQQLRTALGAD